VFTKNTIQEVDFLLEELSLQPGSSILDVGCGTGRHSIELAKRGYTVTGLDLSSEMLTRAADAAKSAGVNVNWIRSDATQFSLHENYDGAICLCEGAFRLLGQKDDSIDQPVYPVQYLPKPETAGKDGAHRSQCDGNDSQAHE
jgi:ubiquinone/menaquinone biosynthesis C-methylase UbiE